MNSACFLTKFLKRRPQKFSLVLLEIVNDLGTTLSSTLYTLSSFRLRESTWSIAARAGATTFCTKMQGGARVLLELLDALLPILDLVAQHLGQVGGNLVQPCGAGPVTS